VLSARVHALADGIRGRVVAHAPMLALLLLAAAVWLPFGVHKTGLIEEWTFYKFLDEGQSVIGAEGLRDQTTRPFLLLSWALGYWLTPDSFVGLNLVHLLTFVGRGLVVYSILRRLMPNHRAFGLLAAALFLVHPADESLFELRVMNYHVATFLYLCSARLLMAYWDHPRALTLAALWATQLLGLGTSEAAYPLVLVTPIVLYWMSGRLNARIVRIASLWYAVPAAFLAWMVPRLLRPGNFVAAAVNSDAGTASFVSGFAYAVGRAYLRTLFTCWTDIVIACRTNPSYPGIGAAAAAIVGLAAWAQHDGDGGAQTRRAPNVALVAGLGALGLGFLPFALSYVRLANGRVFLLSSAGAAVAVVSLLYLVSRRFGRALPIFVVIASLLVGAATVLALERHRRVVVASLREQKTLAGFAREMPRMNGQPLIVLYDPFAQFPAGFESTWATSGAILTNAMHYLYHDPRYTVFLCYPNEQAAGLYNDGCAFRDRELAVFRADRSDAIPYDRVVVFRLGCDGDVYTMRSLPTPRPAYDPDRFIDHAAGPPTRVHTMLRRWPFRIPSRFRMQNSCVGTPTS
jgi:hypothetical protein